MRVSTNDTVSNLIELSHELSPNVVIRSLAAWAQHSKLTASLAATATDALKDHVFTGIAFYVISVGLADHLFRDRLKRSYEANKRTWKHAIAWYNVLMSVYSGVTGVLTYAALSSVPNGLYSNDGTALFAHSNFELLARAFYVSKYVEYFDTYFLIVTGKPVTWLHYFHHCGAALDMWILYHYSNEGIFIFVQFNSVIHTAMYAYYAATAFGVSVPGKHFLTILQIVQLGTGNTLGVVYLALDAVVMDVNRMTGFVVNFIYISALILFFINFALQTARKKKMADKSEGTNGSAKAHSVGHSLGVDRGTTHVLPTALLSIGGVIAVAVLARSAEQKSGASDVGRTIVTLACGAVALFAFMLPSGPFRCPHRVVWRVWLGFAVVYELFLLYLLSIRVDDARQFMRHFDSSLGQPLTERTYAAQCELTWENVHPTIFDRFFAAHFIGWIVKRLSVRDTLLCWVISIVWEALEVCLMHLLPNFAECWWDQWILDVLITNGLGIACGAVLEHVWFKRAARARMVAAQPSDERSFVKRILSALSPTEWVPYRWRTCSSLIGFAFSHFVVFVFTLLDLNGFFLKAILWIPPESDLNVCRLMIWCGLGPMSFRELYDHYRTYHRTDLPNTRVSVVGRPRASDIHTSDPASDALDGVEDAEESIDASGANGSLRHPAVLLAAIVVATELILTVKAGIGQFPNAVFTPYQSMYLTCTIALWRWWFGVWGGGLQFVMHGVTCFLCYGAVLYPYDLFWMTAALLYEQSTPWLHVRWLCLHTVIDTDISADSNGCLHRIAGRESSVFRFAQIMFALTFAGVRIVAGTISSSLWWREKWMFANGTLTQPPPYQTPHSFAIVWSMFAVCVVLNVLNWVWFRQIVKAALSSRSKLAKPQTPRGGSMSAAFSFAGASAVAGTSAAAASPVNRAGAGDVKYTQSNAGVYLELSDVNISYVTRRRKWPCASAAAASVDGEYTNEKRVLTGLHGRFAPGLSAIMGASGAGKTTLLNVLSGRYSRSSALAITSGTLACSTYGAAANGGDGGIQLLRTSAKASRRSALSAYVLQRDLLHPGLTVRQTLNYAAELRLSESLSSSERDACVRNVLDELELAECADRVVGNALQKGISDGEKRRLSVAVQLLTSPPILLMDEITTGLDPGSALRLMTRIRALTYRLQKTVIVSIHTPSAAIFELFDTLLLLVNRDGGGAAYFGPREHAIPYFTSPPLSLTFSAAAAVEHGVTPRIGPTATGLIAAGPNGVNGVAGAALMNPNPADWLSDLIVIDRRTADAERRTSEFVERLFRAHSAARGGPATSAGEAVLSDTAVDSGTIVLQPLRPLRQLREAAASDAAKLAPNGVELAVSVPSIAALPPLPTPLPALPALPSLLSASTVPAFSPLPSPAAAVERPGFERLTSSSDLVLSPSSRAVGMSVGGAAGTTSELSSFSRQLSILTRRGYANLWPQRWLLAVLVVEAIVSGVLAGWIHLDTETAAGIATKVALCYQIAMNRANLASVIHLYRFSQQLSIFDHERDEKLYSVIPYIISDIVVHIPAMFFASTIWLAIVYGMGGLRFDNSVSFGGCVAVQLCVQLTAYGLALLPSSVSRTFAIAAFLFNMTLPFSAFCSGYFVAIPSIAVWLSWIPPINTGYHAFRTIAQLQFLNDPSQGTSRDGYDFQCNDAAGLAGSSVACSTGYESGVAVLNRLSFMPSDSFPALLGFAYLLCIAFVLTSLAVFVLWAWPQHPFAAEEVKRAAPRVVHADDASAGPSAELVPELVPLSSAPRPSPLPSPLPSPGTSDGATANISEALMFPSPAPSPSPQPSPVPVSVPSSVSGTNAPNGTNSSAALFSFPVPVSGLPVSERSRPAMNVSVRDLTLTAGAANTVLLHRINAEFATGALSIILGPSGSSKTTLLALISGQTAALQNAKKHSSGAVAWHLTGSIRIGKHRVVAPSDVAAGSSDASGLAAALAAGAVAFVGRAEHELLLAGLSVHETLRFRADLQFPHLTDTERRARIKSVIGQFGLRACAHTLIGRADGVGGGISGGERRRAAMALALLSRPRVLILDEPTSGLDASSALHITQMLHAFARTEHVVVLAALHQPRPEQLPYFDHITMMSRGSCVYTGAQTGLRPALARMGFTYETGNRSKSLAAAFGAMSEAEWLLQVCEQFQPPSPPSLAIVLSSSPDGVGSDNSFVGSDVKSPAGVDTPVASPPSTDFEASESPAPPPRAVPLCGDCNAWTAVPVLCRRTWTNFYRQRGLAIGRFLGHFGFPLYLLGIFHGTVGFDQTGVADRLGLIQALTSAYMLSILNAIVAFPPVRNLYYDERAMYSTASFVVSYTLGEVVPQIVMAVWITAIGMAGVGLTSTSGDASSFTLHVFCIWCLISGGESTGMFFCALAQEPAIANSLTTPLQGALAMMAGVYAPSMPAALKDINRLSLFRYAVRIIGVTEFGSGLTGTETPLAFYCTSSQLIPIVSGGITSYQCPITSGLTVSDLYGWTDVTTSDVWVLALLVVGYRVVAGCALSLFAPKR